MGHTRLLEISAAARENTSELMHRVARLLEKVDAALPPSLPPSSAPEPTLEAGWVERVREGGREGWRAIHPKVTSLALTLVDVDYYMFEERVREGLEAVGLLDTLREKGARVGEKVWVTPENGGKGGREGGREGGVYITL